MSSLDSTPALITELIASVQGRSVPRDTLAAKAIDLAKLLAALAAELQTPKERGCARRLATLLDDPSGLGFGQILTDRAHRPRSASKVVHAARAALSLYGVPQSLPVLDRVSLWLLQTAGPWLPDLAAKAIALRIERETEPYLIPGQWLQFERYMADQHALGLRVNVNRLGEEVLSNADAEQHIQSYLELLARPEVTTISVKISAICSRINVLAWDDTLTTLREGLRRIYRAANRDPQRLVYLDMESYRDLALNLELFQSLLSEPEFLSLSAGVVLQAYIPESAVLQSQLTAWANDRVARGGAPIRLRIAKGANLGMESVESSLRGWLQPTYGTKREVDANYKRLLEFGTQPEHAKAVHLGVASHNLFDISYGILLRAMHATEGCVGFELLQGMADPLCRALQRVVRDVLIYAPMVTEQEFTSSIAYLVRRLDENSAPENFLRHSFGLTANSAAFENERQKFLVACLSIDGLSREPKRNQDRNQDASPGAPPSDLAAPFKNEPDSDFSRVCNRSWLAQSLSWRQLTVADLPLFVDGEQRSTGLSVAGSDPSRPGIVPYRHSLASATEIESAIAAAERGLVNWRAQSSHQRAQALLDVASGLRRARGELIACMVCDAGKRVEEADVEVSEAIDFAEYYARSLLDLERHVRLQPRGVTVVTPPWNFPLAIPLGGALGALALGNTVILKPAPETVLVAECAAHTLWAAGIPHDAFQLITAEDEAATALISDPRVATVVLTGATSTALHFRQIRPRLHLCAETGGKNAILVTAFADRELAIRDTLTSAFGHAGQKCSAASLLILEAEVYDDAHFLEKLRSAAASLVVGSAWDPTSFVTPLIRPPQGALQHALNRLDTDESWLLEPKISASNPLLYSPGIKLGVRAGSFSHRSELFGPVLSVLRADDLEHAVQLANDTPYGLTAGLHSLDEQEQHYFLEHMNAGNLYVNRTITGAIVSRQPFGGRKGSSIGPGLKAGGPNYLLQFAHLTAPSTPNTVHAVGSVNLPPLIDEVLQRLCYPLDGDQRIQLRQAARDYQQAYIDHFRDAQDPFQLLGQENWLVYQPSPVLLRLDPGASALDVARVALAAQIAAQMQPDARMHVSTSSELAELAGLVPDAIIAPGAIEELPNYLRTHQLDRIRALGNTPEQLFVQLASSTVHLASEPVLSVGRVELLHYVREQSRSITTHRYGHLSDKNR